MTISKVIKQKRIEKQLTQEDLAEMLLVSKKTISNWENGRTIPGTENL
ncbi:TPA: helix-turn-helix transcriptional regulator, partial [Enterococcus faecium]|nr:helix-turn-helix transcriptional regulator [Enterococcus faecium]